MERTALGDRTPQVHVLETGQLTDTQREQIVTLCVAANDNDEFRRLFTFYLRGAGRHVIAVEGSIIVSHAVVTSRWLQAADAPVLHTAFVDAVATLPSAQGEGHASAVMSRLSESIDDFEIGCLQTDLRGFYERFGWTTWEGPLAGRDTDGSLLPTPHQRGVMVLQLPRTPPLDPTGLLTIESQGHRIWS